MCIIIIMFIDWPIFFYNLNDFLGSQKGAASDYKFKC